MIAYEMLSGERPFIGEQISTVVYKIVAEQPVPIQSLNTTLKENVDKAIRRALAKKPERRFATCTAFVIGLDSGLAGSKGWKVVPRKTQQEIPTAPTGMIVPALKPKQNESERKRGVEAAAAQVRNESGGWFVPFFGAFVVLAVILALVAWQTGLLDLPWLNDLGGHDATPAETTPAPAQDRGGSGRPSPMPAAPSDAEIRASKPAAPPAPVKDVPREAKDVLVETPKAPKASAPAVVRPVEPPSGPVTNPVTNQVVQVMTDPAGATAMLDSNPDVACTTPCSLAARSGVHNVALRLEGYQPEIREVRVASQDVELGLVSLRSANGVLMLTSDPTGAEVFLDGKDTGYQTPARISLPAGHHLVAIQKNGSRTSDMVDISNGDFRSLKLIVPR